MDEFAFNFVRGAKRLANRVLGDDDDSERRPVPTGPTRVEASAGTLQQQDQLAHQKAVYQEPVKSGYIRVLVPVYRLDGSDGQRYVLKTVALESRPQYHALSYTWGSFPKDNTITIDEKPFLVSRHPKVALQQLDRSSSPSHWVDAICINQTDNEEKAIQVAQMTVIYEQAVEVFIWLGSGTFRNILAFSLIRNLGNPSDNDYRAKLIRSYASPTERSKWDALARVFANPYWTRAWIFQEILASARASVWLGEESISWVDIAALATTIEESTDELLSISSHTPNVLENSGHLYNLALYQRQCKFLSPPSLSEALNIRRRAKATDPRDKVYSLLGICREEQALSRELRGGFILTEARVAPPSSSDLRIDYSESRTVADVYIGAACHIMRTSNHLEILSACQNPERRQGIPSWAPDWSTPRLNGPLVAPDIWGRIYSACGNKQLDLRHNLAEGEIALTGVWADRIQHLGASPDGNWRTVEMPWARLAMMCARATPDGIPLDLYDDVPTDAHCLNTYGERISTAFLRTCTTDRLEEFRVPFGEPSPGCGNIRDSALGMKELAARRDATENRRFAVTQFGSMCLVPKETTEGDHIVVLAGADVPFVIRKLEDGNVIVGECYAHGLMYGEVHWLVDRGLDGPSGTSMRWESITLR